MAEFKEAFENTLRFEDAGLSGRVTRDAGGRTRFGIAEKFHPELSEDFFTGPAEAALQEAEAIEERDYWTSMRLGEISSQPVANKLFDMAVNMGIRQAAVLAQRGVNALAAAAGGHSGQDASVPDYEASAKLTVEGCGATTASEATQSAVAPPVPIKLAPRVPIKEDGVMGAITLAAINGIDPDRYLEILRELSAGFYRHVASLHPAEAVDLTGWLRRAKA